MRREYAGAARKAKLAAPLGGTSLDIGIVGDELTGWPEGGDAGPFYIAIGRGTATEEKILIASRTVNSLTVYTDGVLNGRGADGTNISAHALDETLEHVWTATDADESNEHVNATGGVHGVISDLVGVDDTQTLTNKSMDGNANTFTNLPMAAVTGLIAAVADIVADIAAVEAVNVSQSTLITNLTSSTNIALTSINNQITEINDHLTVVDGSIVTLNTLLIQKAPINNPTFTGIVTLPAGSTVGGVAIGGGALPPGGEPGMILVKNSLADYDGRWAWLSEISGAGSHVIAQPPYPIGGIVGAGESGCWLTYTSGGYTYRAHKWHWTGNDDELEVTNGALGTILVVGGAGAGGNGDIGGAGAGWAGGGGAGALYEQAYAFGVGIHRVYVGKGGVPGAAGDGETSKFDDIWCYGGGRGATRSTAGHAGGFGGGRGEQLSNPGGAPGAGLYGSLDAGVTTDTLLVKGGPGLDFGGSSPGGGISYVSLLLNASNTYSVGGPAQGGSGGGAAGANHTGNGGQGGGNSGAAGGAGGHGIVVARYRIA